MRTFCLAVLATAFAFSGSAIAAPHAAQPQEHRDIDHKKVAVVNKIARHRGVRVIWVHLPTKKKAVAAR
jgi:hypothetical protein